MLPYTFADVEIFRVKLPEPLFPFDGSQLRSAVAEILPPHATGWLRIDELSDHFTANFAHRNRLNVPGPFYGAETDNCATGPLQAPDNVLLDGDGYEFVFRQPSTAIEFQQVVMAAICECYQGYGADGNEHWRLSLIREWWRDRRDYLQATGTEYCSPQSLAAWRFALEGGA